jgi:hypothetical protein
VLLALAGLLALVPWVLPQGAAAQDEEPTPLPLDPLAPVLAVLGPASSTVCGGFGVVGLLGPAALGAAAPSVLSALGPVFTLCGAVPTTPADDRYTCALDQSSLSLVGSVTGLAGVPPAVDVRPIAQVLETLDAALDLVLPPAQVDELLEQAGVVLQCQHGTAEDPVPPDVPTSAPVAGPASAPLPPVPATTPSVVDLPPVRAARPERPVTAPSVVPGVTTPLGRVPFSYAAVFALPFIALLAGAAVGRDLLAPLAVDLDS